MLDIDKKAAHYATERGGHIPLKVINSHKYYYARFHGKLKINRIIQFEKIYNYPLIDSFVGSKLIMKKHILERYSQGSDRSYIIGINAGKVSDLYNAFDKHMPYVRKELDQDLAEYIADSARDLSNEDFIIRFQFVEPPEDIMKERIKTSINSYFIYLKTIELKELSRVMRTSLIFFIIGIAILFLSVWVNEQITSEASVISKVFAEGLTVAAWVSLWEALATFIINWTPYTRQIKLYERIANAPVQFM